MGFLKTIIIFVIISIIVMVGAFYFLSQPTPPAKAYVEQAPQEFRSANANLGGALYSGGIADPFVDVTAERAYVAYELPAGYDSEMAQRFVIGAAADAAPTASQIIALQYSSGKPTLLWKINMSAFKAFMNAQLTTEQMEAKIEKKSY
jgi:hypothetical protein